MDTSLGGQRVGTLLNRLAKIRGLSEVITIDSRPEFTRKALDEWVYRRVIKVNFIRTGRPIENTYIENIKGRFKDECFNTNWFIS